MWSGAIPVPRRASCWTCSFESLMRWKPGFQKRCEQRVGVEHCKNPVAGPAHRSGQARIYSREGLSLIETVRWHLHQIQDFVHSQSDGATIGLDHQNRPVLIHRALPFQHPPTVKDSQKRAADVEEAVYLGRGSGDPGCRLLGDDLPNNCRRNGADDFADPEDHKSDALNITHVL